jgi:CubicO group peptidase (beta-lactamase class C family)
VKKLLICGEEKTLVDVFSVAKGISGLAMALAYSRGLFDIVEFVEQVI